MATLKCLIAVLKPFVELFFRLYFRGFFTPLEGERGPGIPCHDFCANSYMPHVTLLSIQSCFSQGFTGAGKWKIAFIHSSWSSTLCLPMAQLYCAGLTDKISAPPHPVTPEAAFAFPLTFIILFFRRRKVFVEKFAANWFETLSIYLWKIHRFAPASLNLLWSGRARPVMWGIDRLSISKQKRDSSLCVHLMTHRRFILSPSFHTKCLCVCVCTCNCLFLVFWDLIGLRHIYTVRQEGLPSFCISLSCTPILSCLVRKLEMTITFCAAHPSVVCVSCTILLFEILMEQSSSYFRLLILIIKLTVNSFPFWLEILDTLHMRSFSWGELE